MDQTTTKLQHPISSEETIQGVLHNNNAVLKSLYNEVFPKVRVHILQNNGNEAQAKDLFQEAFLALWRNIKEGKYQLHETSAVQAYLYTIAKNKWIDHLRSAGYRKTISTNNIGPLGEAKEDTEEVQERNKEQKKYKEAMIQALAQLGEQCRAVLTQFYFDRKSIEDIAGGLNIASASARNKKYRCMEKLRVLALEYKQNGR